MSKNIMSIMLLLALLLAACGSAAPNLAPGYTQSERSANDYASGAPAPEGKVQAYDVTVENMSQTDRLVIKNASLTIVVDEPTKASQAIGELAEKLGGYVVSANLYQTHSAGGQEIPQASITIRIPAEQLNEALAGIKAQSEKDATSENISSQDVTSEYTDLQSRLRNAEAAEVELARIMEAANKTEDVLGVHAQLKTVREEIEVLKGQIQYYEQSAAYSMINVELVAKESIQPLEIGGWEPQGVARDAIQSLINAMQFFASAAIWFLLFCAPVMLVLGIPLLILLAIIRFLVRQTRKQIKPQSPLPPATPHDAPVA